MLVLTGEAEGDTGELDDLDGVPAAAQTDVWSLVEDEVLLAIPLAPRHAENECSPAVKTAGEPVASSDAYGAQLRAYEKDSAAVLRNEVVEPTDECVLLCSR